MAVCPEGGTYRGYVSWIGAYLPWTGAGGHLPWTGSIYLGWGVPTLGEGDTYLGSLDGGIPTFDGGYPPPVRLNGHLLPSGWMGYPSPSSRRQSSTASTCYIAGSMPLAFTREDFLVQ